MMQPVTLDNIERIEAPDPETFWNRYVRTRTPVIITNLYQGQKIRELTTREAAVAALGDLPVRVRSEYTRAYFATGKFGNDPPQSSTLAEYLALVDREPDTNKVVVEDPTPPALRALYQPSPLMAAPIGLEYTFVANRGNYAHLHHDWEPDHNIIYQVFGRKRFMVIPAAQGHKLNAMFHIGTAVIEKFSETDKLHFLRYVGAYDAVLDAGEALFMPMLDWHHIEYVDTSMSFNVRFGRRECFGRLYDALGQRMSLHRDTKVQNIGALLNDDEDAARYRPQIDRLLAAIDAAPAGVMARYRHIQEAIERTHDEMCEESARHAAYSYFPVQAKVEEIVRENLRDMGLEIDD